MDGKNNDIKNIEEVEIISWNINSVRQRINHLTEYLRENRPAVILLQEIKTLEKNFPKSEIEDLGYNIEIHGQKTFNGVAILSRYRLEDVSIGLEEARRNSGAEIENGDLFLQGDEANQARYIEAVVDIDGFGLLRVASVYVPNGQEVGSEKFAFKMRFFDMLTEHMKYLYGLEEKQIIAGDFNVAMENIDVYDPVSLKGSVCFHEDEKKKMQKILNIGYSEMFRIKNPDKQQFSWWDYRGGGWEHNKGMRIDYILSSPEIADKCINCDILDKFRGMKSPSDHAPMMIKLR